MTRFRQLSELLKALALAAVAAGKPPSDPKACEAAQEAMAEIVEVKLAKQPLSPELQTAVKHINSCPHCRLEYGWLFFLSKADEEGNLPSV